MGWAAPLAGLVSVVTVVAAFTAGLPAQEQVVTHMAGDRHVCTVRVASFGGAEIGGFGFVVCDTESHDERPHAVRIELSTVVWGGGDISCRRSLLLGPREKGRFFLPRPNTPVGNYKLEVQVDATTHELHFSSGSTAGYTGLLVSERGAQQVWATTVLQAMPGGITNPPTVQLAPPEHVPADWRLFSGFEAVLVDGRCRVAAEQQEALRRFVFAGGSVVVGEPDRLPPGALRELATKDDTGVVRHGLGHCITVRADVGDTAEMRNRLARLPQPGSVGWPASSSLLVEQPVPGLGQAPVFVFLFVILLFAVLVGPVNFLLLRRLRRPLLVLVTVPACGIGTTLVMLGHGFLHDGLGVRGVVRSWTLVDQERHEAVSLAARTLFCGISPSSLSLTSDTLVVARRAAQHEQYGEPDRWHFDGGTNTLDGGVLPSRRPTPLLTAQQGVVRQRLRVRTSDADRLELLTDGGIVPEGEVLLHDLDGEWWLGEAPTLRRATEQDAQQAIARWRRIAGALAPVPAQDHTRWDQLRAVRAPEEDTASLQAMVTNLLGAETLPRGRYLARVADAPWLDQHGMRIDYDAAEHSIVGQLAVEDFVR